MTALETLRARLDQIEADLRSIDTEAGDAPLNPDQQTRFDGLVADRATVKDQVKAEEARAALRSSLHVPAQRTESGDAAASAGERVARAKVTEPLTYSPHTRTSYFLDIARAQLRRDPDAMERLNRHSREMAYELPIREARMAARARQQLEALPDLTDEQRAAAFESRANPNRTDGQGGYFVPPVYLVDQYVDLPRFGRTVANLVQGFDLPSGTDSISLPKIATGTATAVQTADGGSVQSTDLTDSLATAGVKTVAGQQDIALQLLDQSPVAFDQIIFQDLRADLNSKLDVYVINGSGSSGQPTGILNVSGVNSITYTDASVTLPEMYPAFAQAASKVFTGRKLPATAAVLYPSTWYWATGQLDTSNRPLITSPTVSLNPAGTQSTVASDQGPAGALALGLPVYLDGNIPTNLGGGSNETRAIVARWNDLYLWEGMTQARVVDSVLSGTLQVRLQLWEYFAFMGDRRPTSISVISGTGMIPQSGY